MKILITGVAGFIGTHLAHRLLNDKHEVYGLDIVLRGQGSKDNISELKEYDNFHFFETSILDVQTLETLIEKCDCLYHLAAAVGVENIIGDILKVIDVNVDGTKNVASLAYKYNKKVVFASTSEIYGKSQKVPFKEDDDRLLGATSLDRWVYSCSKALGEYMFIGYHRQGLPMTIVRFFNVYGPKLDIEGSGRVISRFIVQALSGKDITVVGDGKQTRSFSYIDDIVEGLVKCITIPESDGEILNLGNPQETSLIELANIVKEIIDPITNTNSKIVYINAEDVYSSGYEDIPRRVPNIERAKHVLDFSITIGTREGVKKTIEWFLKRKGLL